MKQPAVGRKTFQWFVSLMPFFTVLLTTLQSQVRNREFDVWVLGDVAIGAFMSLIVVQANSARSGTETAERTAEIATSRDQDADATIEQTPGQVAGGQ
jgi:uncharacterized membrane protein